MTLKQAIFLQFGLGLNLM